MCPTFTMSFNMRLLRCKRNVEECWKHPFCVRNRAIFCNTRRNQILVFTGAIMYVQDGVDNVLRTAILAIDDENACGTGTGAIIEAKLHDLDVCWRHSWSLEASEFVVSVCSRTEHPIEYLTSSDQIHFLEGLEPPVCTESMWNIQPACLKYTALHVNLYPTRAVKWPGSCILSARNAWKERRIDTGKEPSSFVQCGNCSALSRQSRERSAEMHLDVFKSLRWDRRLLWEMNRRLEAADGIHTKESR